MRFGYQIFFYHYFFFSIRNRHAYFRTDRVGITFINRLNCFQVEEFYTRRRKLSAYVCKYSHVRIFIELRAVLEFVNRFVCNLNNVQSHIHITMLAIINNNSDNNNNYYYYNRY